MKYRAVASKAGDKVIVLTGEAHPIIIYVAPGMPLDVLQSQVRKLNDIFTELQSVVKAEKLCTEEQKGTPTVSEPMYQCDECKDKFTHTEVIEAAKPKPDNVHMPTARFTIKDGKQCILECPRCGRKHFFGFDVVDNKP